MNYKKIYHDFIENRKAKELSLIASGEYSEKHHIIPRSMGGGNDAGNLVRLTAGDHYFAHLCLAKVYGGNQWASVWALVMCPSGRNSTPYAKRKLVAIARKRKAEMMSENNPSHRPEVKEMRRQQLIKNNPITGIDRTGKNNPMYGISLNGAANGMYGKKWSDETRIKMKIADRSSKVRKKVMCIETQEEFKSVTEAAIIKNTYRSNIAKAILGIYKNAGGFTWAYV